MLTQEQIGQFHDQGYLLVENVISADEVEILRAAIDELGLSYQPEDSGLSRSSNYLTVIHDLPNRPGPLARIVQYGPVLRLVEQLIGRRVRVTGGLLLDKDPEHNWEIPWHQDTGIYVAVNPQGEPEDVRGGLPVYTTKGLELAGDLTCRLALDPAKGESGGLYVLPTTHREHLGNKVAERFASEKGVLVPQPVGSALFYAPLILHRSEKMTTSGHRRILHLSWGPADLVLPGAQIYPWPQPCPLTPLEALV